MHVPMNSLSLDFYIAQRDIEYKDTSKMSVIVLDICDTHALIYTHM